MYFMIVESPWPDRPGTITTRDGADFDTRRKTARAAGSGLRRRRRRAVAFRLALLEAPALRRLHELIGVARRGRDGRRLGGEVDEDEIDLSGRAVGRWLDHQVRVPVLHVRAHAGVERVGELDDR